MRENHLNNNYYDWFSRRAGESLLVVSDSMDNLTGMWDCLVVSGAFAKAPVLFGSEAPYEKFFGALKEHLNPGGHLLLAADNRYGLRCFAGCQERQSGRYFEGLEGFCHSEGAVAFSKEAVLAMAKEAGFVQAKTYYPYPDYRWMTTLYTEERQPAPGEWKASLNLEEERLILFDEAAVMDSLIRDGKFSDFADTYLFDLTLEKEASKEELLYLKYSVERREEFRICTEIIRKADGTKAVRKLPYTRAAEAHIRKLKHYEALLQEQYEPAGVRVNRCALTAQGAEFEFLEGRTLEAGLDEKLAGRDYAGFMSEIKAYAEKLERLLKPHPFTPGTDFTKIFGDVTFAAPQTAASLNNIDLIFSNIILTDGIWNVIDYEWTFEFEIPFKFILHRGVNLYFEQKRPIGVTCEEVCRMLDISKGEAELFLQMEHRLQSYLLGDTKTLEAVKLEHTGRQLDLQEILHRGRQSLMKVYEDYGQGFSEDHSYTLEPEEDFYGRRRFTLNIPQGVTALRLDPCEEACLVTVNRLLGECGGSYELQTSHNGKAYEKSILYTTTDPQLLIGGIVPGTGQIHGDLTVEYLKEETAYVWMKLLERAEKCDRIENSRPYRLLKKIFRKK